MSDTHHEEPILRRGAAGPAVYLLREQLRALGYKFGSERDFGDRTEAAVVDFQTKRRLRADGVCGPQTWAALQEAAWALGDRIIALRSPNLRGDDVNALQHRLSALGFDPGRPDGIFGLESETALREFQRNAGVASDGVCGPATIAALNRLDALAGGSVAAVREHETMVDAPRVVSGRRICLIAHPSTVKVVDLVSRGLDHCGALVEVVDDPDPRTAAERANRFAAEAVVALLDPEPQGTHITYFGNDRFQSVAGRTHATRISEELAGLGLDVEVCLRTTAFLRETRMAAVAVHLGGAGELGSLCAEDLAGAIARGIRRGFEEAPVETDR